MKKIIILSLFSALLFSSQVSFAETYPSTCDSLAQSILNATGGCSTIDCNTLSNICAKCCTQDIPQISIISSFESEEAEINSGDLVNLSFSGSGVSKYDMYFACPKFSGGLKDGLAAASVMIDEEEYCNQVFEIPVGSDTQELIISSKYSKSLNLKIRLRAYNAQDQQATYKDLIIVVNPVVSTDTTDTSDVSDVEAPSIPITQNTTSSFGSSSLTNTQVSTIIGLLEVFGVDASIIANVQLSLSGGTYVSSVSQESSTSSDSSEYTSSTTTTSDTSSEDISSDYIDEDFSYVFNNNLYYGLDNNEDVEALQSVLTLDGVYTGPITGNFYSLTRQGVIDFQTKHNFTMVPDTGYVGPYTRKILNGLYFE